MAVTATFTIARSSPYLGWLARLNLPRRVPREIADSLSKFKSLQDAQEFVQSAGLKTVEDQKKVAETDTTFAVFLPGPIGRSDEYYHRPQIFFPKLETEAIPFGTVLANFLLPETKTLAEGRQIFEQFQRALTRLATVLESGPFVCISGFKSIKEAPHDLYLRGFRFFFSPEPDKLYARIENVLSICTRLSQIPPSFEMMDGSMKAMGQEERSRKSAEIEEQMREKIRLVNEVRDLKRTIRSIPPLPQPSEELWAQERSIGNPQPPQTRNMPHEILNDVELMDQATVLADLR